MVISKHIKFWNRKFRFVMCSVVSSILTVPQQTNTEEYDSVYFDVCKISFAHIKNEK